MEETAIVGEVVSDSLNKKFSQIFWIGVTLFFVVVSLRAKKLQAEEDAEKEMRENARLARIEDALYQTSTLVSAIDAKLGAVTASVVVENATE